MKSRALLLIVFALFATHVSVSAQPNVKPDGPIAHTPDAVKVLQSSMSQSDYPSAPIGMVFTEFTFGDAETAFNYFNGICAFLESDMAEISPEGMAYLDLRQEINPQCGYARMKGTQATTAVVHENRVLTIWAFGLGLAGSAGDFMEVFMWTSTPIVEEATLPNRRNVESPWSVDSADIDITEYAQTAIELRD